MRAVRSILESTRWLFAFTLLACGFNAPPRSRAHDPPSAGGSRATYFSDVTVVTQDGEKVRFYQDLIKGRIVVISVMYTNCDGYLCEAGTKNLVKLQEALGDRLGRDVFMYSITLQPETDTPKVLKAYAERHGVKPGWTFLTGDPEQLAKLRERLGLVNQAPKAADDRAKHTGMIKIGNDLLNKWSVASVLSSPDKILQIIERIKPPPTLSRE